MIFGKQTARMVSHKQFSLEKLAPRARFELATLRLTAEMIENLSALSGVAYKKLGAIFSSLVAPTPAPTPMASDIDYCQSVIRSVEMADLLLLPTTGLLGS